MRRGLFLLNETSIVGALLDSGCSKEQVEDFNQYTLDQQLCFLNEERSAILCRLHDAKNHLDCLDYLRYQLTNSKNKGND